MEKIVLVSGARTPIGSFGGSLKDFSATDLAAITIKEAIARSRLELCEIDEAVIGCVATIAEDAYCARVSAIKAGMSVSSTALTVNRLCSSGLQAIVTGAMEIQSGFANIIVAGGTESMTNIPYYLRKARYGYRMGHSELEDGLITVLSDPFSLVHMGQTAENIAEKFCISREEQDEYALNSQFKAAKACDQGLFNEEIVPVTLKNVKNTEKSFVVDEHIRRDISIEKLTKLHPAFKGDGSVTAGNSSGINDGSASVILMKENDAKKRGIQPIVRIIDFAVAGVDPSLMGIGPVDAIKKLLLKTGIKKEDIGLFELNEAFASQSIACINLLDLDEHRVNVNGGAIALGHPIGASGCIITIKLMNEMKRRNIQFGISTLCIGGGQGLAVLFELC